MKTKLLKRLTAYLCICLMIIGVFPGNYVMAKTSETNYTIDVENTENGTFILSGNTTKVPEDITLLTLTDKEGHQYDPMEFRLETGEEKTYEFDLQYKNSYDEIKQEEISVETKSVKKENLTTSLEAEQSQTQEGIDSSQTQEETDSSQTQEGTDQSPDQEGEDNPIIDEEGWALAENKVFQLVTQYSDDHSYMEVSLENISGKDIYEIASVTDGNGNDYTADTSWRLDEAGTYTYEIKYYDNESGYKYKETHEVVVDDIQSAKTIAYSFLLEKADAKATISMYAYQYGTTKKIQENALSVPTGMISENKNIFTLPNYDFQGVYVKRGGEKGVLYEVTSIYTVSGEIYYTVNDQNSTQPTIAYQLTQDEELGAYYLKSGVKSRYTLQSGVADPAISWEITAMDYDNNPSNGYQVYEGTEVAIKIKYPNNYASVDLQINGAVENYVKKEEHLVDNYTIFTFDMPAKDVTFTVRKNDYNSNMGLLAVLVGDNKYFNAGETGYSVIGSLKAYGGNGQLNGSNIIYALGVGNGSDKWYHSTNGKTYPTSPGDRDPFNRVISTIFGWEYADNYVRGGTLGGQVNQHSGTDSNGSEVKSPIATFTRGQEMNFTYVLKRVHVGREDGTDSTTSYWGMTGAYYDYSFSNLYIEYFPNQTDSTLQNEDFTNRNGNTIVKEGIKVPAITSGNSITTTLRNGAEVTVKVEELEEQNLNAEGKIDTSQDGTIKATVQKQRISITIKGLYDDFRLTASSASNTNRFLSFRNVDGIVTGVNADESGDVSSYVPTAKYGNLGIETGLTLVAANDSPSYDGTFEFILNPLDGYSVPQLTKYAYTGNKEEITYGNGVENVEIVTGKFPDENGLYHYRYRRNGASNAERIKYFDVTANPIQFIVDYTNLTNKPGYVTNSTKFNVSENSYFSIPADVPTRTDGWVFQNWAIAMVDPGTNPNDAPEERYLKDEAGNKLSLNPGDLVSVGYVYEMMQKNGFMGQDDIGKSNYKIQFIAQWAETVGDGSYKTDGQIHIFNQTSGVVSMDENLKPSTGYSTPSVSDGTLINNQKYVVGANVALGNYSDEKTIGSATYLLNETNSKLSMKTTADPLIGYLTYDKAITVEYDLNGGAGQAPTDGNTYTTVSGHDSVITLSKTEPAQSEKEFTGWKIISGTYESAIYKYESSSAQDITIDLSTLSDDLRNSIFTEGKVKFVAQYQSPVAAIQHTDGTLDRKNDGYSWFNEYSADNAGNQALSITKQFKYDGDNASYQRAKEQGLIHTAIYQQAGGAGNFTILSSDVGNTKPLTPTFSDALDSNSCFEVTYLITAAQNVTYDEYNLDSFAIFAWSSANAAESFSDTSCPDSFEANAGYGKVPFRVQQIYVLRAVTHTMEEGSTGTQGQGKYGWVFEDNTKLRQWAYEDETSITITKEFKYDGDAATFEKAKSTERKIHVALYRQDPNSGGGSAAEDNAAYRLLDSDLRPEETSNQIDFTISALDANTKKFTVTYTITKDVAYANDNYARYAILVWTAANGDAAYTDTGITGRDTINITSNGLPKLPVYSQTVWVMKPYAIAENGSNQITKKALLYEKDTTFSIEQSYTYDERMTEAEVKSEALTQVNLYKRNPSDDEAKAEAFLWIGTHVNAEGYDPHYTDDSMAGDGVKKISDYEITVNDDGTFTVSFASVNVETAQWNSKAEWTLLCWNQSNELFSNPPYIPWAPATFSLNKGADLSSYPVLKLTTYVISGENIPEAMFTIPASVKLESDGKGTIGRENLSIEIKGVYNSYQSGYPLVEDDPAVDPASDDVLHNFDYTIAVSHDAGTDPKVTLTQTNTNKTFDVYFYNSNGNRLTSGSDVLGTLGFAVNKDKQSLQFSMKCEESALPDISTKDQFVGTGNYTITRTTKKTQ